jgi:hypothetical protein
MNGPIGARVVRHGRYVLCQITEVAVPKDVVRDDWNTGKACGVRGTQPVCCHPRRFRMHLGNVG